MDRSAPRPATQRIELEGVAPAGGDSPFTALLASELPRLQRIARLLVGDGETADDLVAEAIARTLPRWRDGLVSDPPAYLRRVLVNLVHRRWRRRRLSLRSDHSSVDWLAPVTDRTAVVDERDRTLRAVGALPPRRRAVVVLRFYDDLDEAAIAATLGVSVGTVKSTLSRALEQLRAELGALEGS